MTARQNIVATIYDQKGRVLSVGKNSYDKSHPFQAKLAKESGLAEKIYLHAEIDALLKGRLDSSRAYRIKVERFNKVGKALCAKPCPICQRALTYAGIKVIEHT